MKKEKRQNNLIIREWDSKSMEERAEKAAVGELVGGKYKVIME